MILSDKKYADPKDVLENIVDDQGKLTPKHDQAIVRQIILIGND